ncbi:hypothetical protein GGU10DRAFT_172974 [Lentinula aff. detonsa]|uniref:Uncharacterized protein n=1 Tax=Lentinula aff. detonsa TaxID=2804958 RepID=A0AA38NJZ0_9AGAR|nr:hypothetical protein GGU10DRAFT_172974 [Lentinula aff. detonsa]
MVTLASILIILVFSLYKTCCPLKTKVFTFKLSYAFGGVESELVGLSALEDAILLEEKWWVEEEKDLWIRQMIAAQNV